MTTQSPYIPQPTTLLEAINIMLGVIGVANVSTLLVADSNTDVSDALKGIHNASMIAQETGWAWNTEEGITLDPNGDGEIVLPGNCLKADPWYDDLVVRDGKFYDNKKTHSFNIGKSVKCNLIVGLDFEALPMAMRTYVTISAARTFASGKLSDGAVNNFTADSEYQALAKVEGAEDQSDGRPLKDKNPVLRRQSRHRRRT